MEVNYEQAVAYIEDIPRFTEKHPLEHTREFIRRLGHPGEDRRIIHVAGTNGKDSVCAYIQAILTAEGKRTGFFTSPHLVSVNERICVDQKQIDNDTFLDVFQTVLCVAEQMKEEGMGHPSYFEFLYGMAMTAFARTDVEYIILETGLGGRLDATNCAASPYLTVITSISLDHTDILGDTIEEIAAEKAGIIKKNVPLIYDGSNEKASEVIKKQAQKMGAPCREISKNAFEIREITRKYIAFSRVNEYDEDVTWKIPICGIYQAGNAAIALEAAEYALRGQTVHRQRWQEALCSLRWEGRMEEVSPHIIIDGAHNPGAVEAFAESVNALGLTAAPVILFSAVADKKYEQMIAYLCGHLDAKAYVVTEIDDKRKVAATRLAEIFGKYTDRQVVCCKELEEAMEEAVRLREENGDIYCLGSLYLAGMVKKLLAGGVYHA